MELLSYYDFYIFPESLGFSESEARLTPLTLFLTGSSKWLSLYVFCES